MATSSGICERDDYFESLPSTSKSASSDLAESLVAPIPLSDARTS